jgi:hypothetical protein
MILLLLVVALVVVGAVFWHPRRVRAVILFLLVVALVVAFFWPARRETVAPPGTVRFHPELEDPPLPEEPQPTGKKAVTGEPVHFDRGRARQLINAQKEEP